MSVVRSVEVNLDAEAGESVKGITMPGFTGGFFSVSVFILLFWAFAFVFGLGYFTIQPLADKLDKEFIQKNSEMTALLADQASEAVAKGSLTSFIQSIRRIVEMQNRDARFGAAHEIFFLERGGLLAAHSDLTEITTNAASRVSKISGDYNNELFHAALLNDKGDVLIQKYPYEKYRSDHKFLILFESLLPPQFFETVDFSAPVYKGSSSKGTLHVIASRTHIYDILKGYLSTYFLALLAAIFGTAIVSLILTVYISRKVAEYNRIVEAIALAPGVSNAGRNLEREIKYIDEKIHEFEKIAAGAKTREEKEVREAILIKSD